jgi:flavin reductase (DIM6/NTAB) family NADH-FMN oxidoreductase RutF
MIHAHTDNINMIHAHTDNINMIHAHTDKEFTCVHVYIQLIPTIVLPFQGIPIIAGCSTVMQCHVHSVHS